MLSTNSQFPQRKKKEPKKKETATAILLFLSLLSVQPHGFTPDDPSDAANVQLKYERFNYKTGLKLR